MVCIQYKLESSDMLSIKTLKLASFNIRYGGPRLDDPAGPLNKKTSFDHERPWYERRDGLVDQVIWEEPHVIGFQEVGFISGHQLCRHLCIAGAQ
jgi:hypothetical protein